MSTQCKNCGANPANKSVCVLHRINPKGETGEWICDDCFTSIETFEGRLHYVHSKTCPSFCDYACNGQAGFDLAEQVAKYIQFTHDGSKQYIPAS